jgi:Methyltransferase domain
VLRLLHRLVPEPLRRALYRHLPDRAWAWVQRATKFREAPLDPRPLARIAKAPLDRLGDPEFMTQELLPAMGLTKREAPHMMPAHLQPRVGRGVQPMQFPNQFGPYLAEMTGAGIRSYVEVGLDQGGAFAITVEILRRFGLRRALGVDLVPPRLLRYWSRPEVMFAQVDSHSQEFVDLLREHAPIDLALIDGDHTEAGVRSDFDALRPYTRILAFHDIVQQYGIAVDVGRVWRAIRREHAHEYVFREFTEQYPELPGARLGIGLAIRRQR